MFSLDSVELRHIRCFVRAAKLGSMSRAALESDLSQPAFSLRIQKLESALGVRLLHRNGRGIVPTAAGNTLFKQVEPLLKAIDDALMESASLEKRSRAEVVIGIVPTMAYRVTETLSPGNISPFSSPIRIVEGFSGHLKTWLAQGDIDLAICSSISHNASVKQIPVGMEPLELVGSDFGLLAREQVKLRELEALPLIVGSGQHSIRKLLERTADENGVKLKIAFEVDGLDAQLRFAEKGLGFAVLPRGTVSGFGYSKTLTSRLIVEPLLPIHIVVASLPHIENQKPHVAQLRDELVQRISATLSKRFFRECA